MSASSERGARVGAATGRRLVGLAIALPLAAAATSAALVASASGGGLRVALGALALVIIAGVAQPVRAVAVALAGIVALGHATATMVAGEAGPVQALAGSLGLLAVGVAADALGAAYRAERAAWDEAARRIDALRPTDAVAGVTKWSHARLAFDRELARARRHGLPLSLLRVAVDQWEVVRGRLDAAAVSGALAEVGAHLGRSCRVVDLIAYRGDGVFAVLLADTPHVGAQVVARRIGQLRSVHAGVRLRVGVASLADELATVDDLLDHAELAAAIAGRIGRAHPRATDARPRAVGAAIAGVPA